ncbi:hypothetical protein [Eudoraea adriatica]|uniref:hypothetical protein n=1 Tax=Eudoraea adriatica TaxID=446681 RepID=UPI0003810B93|nr:hypothetical protein [Eudoraea adriatica]
MKKTNLKNYLFGVMAIFFLSAFNSNTESLVDQKHEITILTSSDNLDQFTSSEELTLKFTYGLNFAGKKKIKNMALDKFKELTENKGFTHLLINEEASYNRQNETGKRNFSVLLVGKAFKR